MAFIDACFDDSESANSTTLFLTRKKGFAEPRVTGQAIIADPALFMYKYLNENTNYGRKHIFCNNCINLFFAWKLLRTFAADLKNIKILNKIMLTGIFIFFILAGLLYIVGMILAAILGGAGSVLGVILGYKATRIIFGLGIMALSAWLMHAGWIEENIHWAWAAFAGIPCAVIGLIITVHNEKLLYLLPLTLLGYGGWLCYAGWIEEDISWVWSAFAGIPLCMGGLALWAFMSDENK